MICVRFLAEICIDNDDVGFYSSTGRSVPLKLVGIQGFAQGHVSTVLAFSTQRNTED